jgi:hypothetical protein
VVKIRTIKKSRGRRGRVWELSYHKTFGVVDIGGQPEKDVVTPTASGETQDLGRQRLVGSCEPCAPRFMVSTIKAFEKRYPLAVKGREDNPVAQEGGSGSTVGMRRTSNWYLEKTIKLVPFGWLAGWGKETRSAHFRRQQMYD